MSIFKYIYQRLAFSQRVGTQNIQKKSVASKKSRSPSKPRFLEVFRLLLSENLQKWSNTRHDLLKIAKAQIYLIKQLQTQKVIEL